MTVDHGSGMASFPLHTGIREPCNSRADAIGANDEIARDFHGLAIIVENDGATDAVIRTADQCRQRASVPDFRPGRPRGIHERAVQQCPARCIERVDPVLGSDLDLHDVFAVMEFRRVHGGRTGRNDAWQQAPPVELHDPAAHQRVSRYRVCAVAATIDDQDLEPAPCHQHGGGSAGAAGADHQHVVVGTTEWGTIDHCLGPLLGDGAVRLRQVAVDVLSQLRRIEARPRR